MSPQYRKARKQWLQDQPEDIRSSWTSREADLKSEGMLFADREEILRDEFSLRDSVLSPYLDRAAAEIQKKRELNKSKLPRTGTGAKPPVEPAETESPDVPKDTGGSAAQDVANVVWAAEHISNEKTKRPDAPTSTAWALLCWARKNPDNFFGQLYRNVVLPSRKELEENRDVDEDNDRLKRTLEKVKISMLKPD